MPDITLTTIAFHPGAELQAASPQMRHFLRLPQGIFSQHPGRFSELTMGMGPLCLAAVLEGLGYEAELRQFEIPGLIFTPEDVAAFVAAHAGAAPVVGISCYGLHIPFAILAAGALKGAYPEKTVLLGGHGPTPIARELVARFPFIDVVAEGESEDLMADLIPALRGRAPLADIAGIWFRDGDRVVHTGPRPKPDLSRLPLPAYHLLPREGKRYLMGYVMTSRGCPYSCGFCTLITLTKKINHRSFEQTLEECRIVRSSFGVKEIFFTDDTFVTDRKRVLAFCRFLIESRFDMPWFCNGRLNLMTEPLMAAMAEAGCFQVRYAMESGDDARLSTLMKDEFTVKQALETLRRSKRFFSRVSVNFIWGFPDEPWEEFQRTLETARRVFNDIECDVHYFLLNLPPGTPVHDRYHARLILKPHLARAFPHWPDALDLISDPRLGYAYLFAGTPEMERKIAALAAFEEEVVRQGFASITTSMRPRQLPPSKVPLHPSFA